MAYHCLQTAHTTVVRHMRRHIGINGRLPTHEEGTGSGSGSDQQPSKRATSALLGPAVPVHCCCTTHQSPHQGSGDGGTGVDAGHLPRRNEARAAVTIPRCSSIVSTRVPASGSSSANFVGGFSTLSESSEPGVGQANRVPPSTYACISFSLF
jgi:hypothetical protein